MRHTVLRGLLAGSVGTALLDATTYLDMALTGRPASTTPGEVVARLAGRLGVDPPDDDRRSAYGALSGLVAGAAVGVGAALARRWGLRVPAPLGVVASAGAAMLASDGTAVALGVTDPRDWTPADWARDVVPHVVFGAGVRWALDATEAPARGRHAAPPRHPSVRVTARALALGLASGARTSLGLTAPARVLGGVVPALTSLSLVAAETTVDKLPSTSSRLAGGALAGRVVTGAVGAAALARRADTPWLLPVASGAAGAVLGSVLGAAWRGATASRGWTWQGAVVEDVAALGLTAWAVR